MGHEIVYCHLCGTRILEKDLLAGKALTLLDKTFCSGCKENAFSQMHTDEPVETETPPARRTSRESTPRTVTPPRPARQVLVRKRRAPIAIYLGGTIGFLGITALLILLIKRAQDQGTPTRNGPPESHQTPAGSNPSTGNSAADSAIKELDDLVRAGATPEAILAKCDALRDTLRGSPHEERWLEIKNRYGEQRALATSEKELNEKIARLKTLIAADKEYLKFVEIEAQINAAKELARTKHPELEPEVDALKRQYIEPYEDEARKWSDANSEWIRTLAQEKRYKEAIKRIQTFPEKLRHSTVWKQLNRQCDDYEKIIGQLARGEGSHTWKEYCRLGGRDIQAKNYAGARANYKKSLEMIPADWKTSFEPEDQKHVLGMYYDLGCLDAKDAKDPKYEQDAAKKESLLASALVWLEKSFQEGLFATACPCHGKWMIHVLGDPNNKDIKGDEDLELLVNDPRFKALLDKYGK